MSRKIHLYRTESEFEEVYDGDGYVEPWLSYTRQTGDVNYNKTYTINVYRWDTSETGGMYNQTSWADTIAHDPIATYTITSANDLKACAWFTGIHEEDGAELTFGSYEIGEGFMAENDMTYQGDGFPYQGLIYTNLYWNSDPYHYPNQYTFQGYTPDPEEWANEVWNSITYYLQDNGAINVAYNYLTAGE